MLFSRDDLTGTRRLTLTAKLGGLFLAWLVLISWLHYHLNFWSDDRQVVKMGYMPVVTNLAAPLLDHVSRKGSDVRYQAVKFSSFAEMAEALRNDSIQAAFIIAPLAIVLRQQGVDVKVVLIGNRHESTLVARKGLNASRIEDLAGRTIAVPMRYSGHNLWLQKMIDQKGLDGQTRVVEMNPPDMASALASGALDAYFVGEPFAAQTVISNDADVVAYVESEWPGFICNLVLVKNSWLASNPDIAARMVAAAARSGIWARQSPDEAARIAARYWNQDPELVRYALTQPQGRIVYDRFVPLADELQLMADMMLRYGLIAQADIRGLVDGRLAREASVDGVDGLESILVPGAGQRRP